MKKELKSLLFGIVILAFVGTLLTAASVHAFSQGVSGYSEDGCGPCHGSTPGANTAVTIDGLPGAYTPDEDYELTVEVTSTDTPGDDGGFDLSVTAGTLVVTDSTNTQLSSGELTNTASGMNQRTWAFNWTAPSSGSVTFYVAGLAADADGSGAGDTWATNSYTLEIIPEFTTLALLLVLATVGLVAFFLARKRFMRTPDSRAKTRNNPSIMT